MKFLFRQTSILLVCILLQQCVCRSIAQDDRPPPPKYAPPILPPSEAATKSHNHRKAFQLSATVGVGIVGAYVGRVMGQKLNQEVKITTAVFATLFILVSLCSERVLDLLGLKVSSKDHYSETTTTTPGLASLPGDEARKGESWWPTLNPLDTFASDDDSQATATTASSGSSVSSDDSSSSSAGSVKVNYTPPKPARKRRTEPIFRLPQIFQRRKVEEESEPEPTTPSWSNVDQTQNYVEDYGGKNDLGL